MGRAPCCDKASVKKGPWSPEEDAKLKQHIEENGTGGNWIALPQKAGLKRCGKSCRLRWLNYLRPNIKHGDFTDHEDRIICSLFTTIGSRWSIIAAQLPGRTDNDIKNYWNTKLKKKLIMGLISIPEIKPNPPAVVSSFSQASPPSPSLQLATELWSLAGPPGNSSLSCNGYMGLNNMQLQPYYNYDHIHQENIISFGRDQARCSSSDGSCGGNCLGYGGEMEYDDYGGGGGSFENRGQMGHFENGRLYGGFEDEQKLHVVSERGVMRKEGGCSEKQSGVWEEETPLEYSLEEIKRLISSSSSSSSCSINDNNNNNNNNNNNVSFDGNYNSGDKVMYYYY